MRIYQSAVDGHWEEAIRLQYKLLELFQTMLTAGNFPAGFRLGYKAHGFDIGHARFPPMPESPSISRGHPTTLPESCVK